MKRLFTDSVLQTLRSEIAACGGNEVFFLGKTDESRIIVAVEPLARGSRDTVAAIMITASFGDVIIHNHPSGNLTPSPADLEIAATMGNQGIGFYIIDNRAEQAYQAVSPFVRTKLNYLSLAKIDAFFQPDGLLSANLAGYEHRSEQTRMALTVAEAFNGDRVAVIEAGTGTGKSLAYLLPAALWAKSNRERVVISTNTINLQEQLTGKDIPFLQKYGKVSFKAALIKGRGNYLCLRKLAARREEPGLFHDEKSALLAIAAWSDKTATGCRDDLGFIPGDDVWEELCSEGDQCGRTKCKNYGRCHFYSSRRNAAAADILVVNHALLMADLSLREQAGATSAAILPPFQRLIIDEAHHLEDVATGNLSNQITRSGLLKLLGKLQHPRRAERGLLPMLSSVINGAIPEGFDSLYRQIAQILDEELLAALPQLVDKIGKEMDGIGYALTGHLRPADGGKGEQKLRLTPAVYGSDFWEESLERINRLAGQLHEFNTALGKVLKAVSGLPEKPGEKLAGIITDIKGVKGRFDGTLLALLHFVGHEEAVCRWFEMKRGGEGPCCKALQFAARCSADIEAGLVRPAQDGHHDIGNPGSRRTL